MDLTVQELNQWIEGNDQEVEEEIKSVLQKISVETMSVITLKSIEVNEVTLVEGYWSEIEEKLEVSSSETDIIIGKDEEEVNEMKLEVISKRSKEMQIENKEDQPLVLVKPPTLPHISVEFKREVEVKERETCGAKTGWCQDYRQYHPPKDGDGWVEGSLVVSKAGYTIHVCPPSNLRAHPGLLEHDYVAS
ncbi:hypothetical protein Sjap_003440 [Stephania japonica]|uniref:Uncharacterized protein n=1 Tax=Stephania japonica TaxID=461633 RepID=A0AAP0KPQ2_9MAGN